MKKIAVITSGLLPVPAVEDGAIEILFQYIIDYNEIENIVNFTVFSVDSEKAKNKSLNYKNSNFNYIKINKIISFIYYNSCRILRKLGIKDINFQYLYMKKVYKKLKNDNYDYILIQSDNHFAYHFLKKTKIPTILYLHNDKLNSSTRFGNQILRNSQAIFTVSNFIKQRVLEINPNFDNRVKVILNGMDLEPFMNKKNDYGLSKTKTYTFLFVGRIEPNKGILELVKAFNELSINNENTQLIIVGGCFHSSKNKSTYLSKVQHEAKNNSNIIFTGYIPHDNIYQYYQKANVLVVPSMWDEPAGLVNIEGIASGLKIIATNVGGIPEYINNSVILVERNENIVNNLKKAMEKAILENVEPVLTGIDFFSKKSYCIRFFETLLEEFEK